MNAPEVNWDTELAGLLAWVKETAHASEGFVLEQAPLVAQEIVAWTFWQGVMSLVAGAVFVVFFLVAYAVANVLAERWSRSSNEMDRKFARSATAAFGFAFLLVLSFFPLLSVVKGLGAIVKANTAPRIVIIDYVTNRIP